MLVSGACFTDESRLSGLNFDFLLWKTRLFSYKFFFEICLQAR